MGMGTYNLRPAVFAYIMQQGIEASVGDAFDMFSILDFPVWILDCISLEILS